MVGDPEVTQIPRSVLNMRFMTLLALVLDSPPNPQEIIQRSVEANQVSWKEAEKYSLTERDVKGKDDRVETVRTYDVLLTMS